VGTRYDVTGAALNFNTTPEVKPRSPADVVTSTANLVTITAAKAALNTVVVIEGVVTAGRATFNNNNAYIQDATSGIQIFNLPLSLSLTVGEAVRVQGRSTTFSGENELVNNVTPTDSLRLTKLGAGATPAPRVITGAEFLARTFEGQLIRLLDVTINTVGTPGGSGTYTVNGTAPDASAIVIFMQAPVGAVPTPAATYIVGTHYDLTGIAVPFGTPSVAEIKPRGAADVVAR